MSRPLERTLETRRIEGLLDHIPSGAGGLVLLEGPAGIGKTTMLDRALEAARDRGIRTLRAVAGELESGIAHGVSRQLLEEVLVDSDAATRASLLEGAAGSSLSVLAVPEGAAGGSVGDPFTALHGLYWLTHNTARGTPLLLVVDDAHWADEPSLRFLDYLARRIDDEPIGLLVAQRPVFRRTEPSPLDELARSAGPDRHLLLTPLSLDGVRTLTTDVFPHASEAVVRQCHVTTGGNPFLLRALLDDLARHETVLTPESIATIVPSAIQRLVITRLRRQGPEALGIARAVAVLGGAADVRRVAALNRFSESFTRQILENLINEQIVSAVAPLAFAHPIVTDAVLVTAEGSDLAQLHLAAAKLLRDEAVTREMVAAHLLHALPGRRPWVVDELVDAATSARRAGAVDLACEYLRRAEAEPPGPERRVDVLVALGRTEALEGRASAADHFREALDLVTDPERRAQISIWYGRFLVQQGRAAEAIDVLDRAAAGLGAADPDGPLAERVRAEAISAARNDVHTFHIARDRLADVARRPPRPERAIDRATLVELAYLAGLDGVDRDLTATRCFDALGGRRLDALDAVPLNSAHLAMVVLTWCGEFDVAETGLSAMLQLARRMGSATLACASHGLRGAVFMEVGRLDEALESAELAISVSERGYPVTLPAALSRKILVLLERGEIEAARQVADSPLPAGWEASTNYHLFLVARAHLALAEGDPRRALAEAEQCERLCGHIGNRNAGSPPWRSAAVRALAGLGELGRARTLAAENIDLSERWGVARPLGVALTTAAEAFEGDRRLALLERAVSVLEGSPPRHELARSLALLAVELEASDPERSASLRSRAAELAAVSGMRALVAELGGPAATLPDGGASVRALAAQGYHTQEIAETLFLTVGQVERVLGERPPASPGEPCDAVSILGGFSVRRRGEAVDLTAVPASLVKLVACAETEMPVDQVIEALWPATDPDVGRTRLRTVLARVRRVAGDVVVRRGDALAIGPEIAVDLRAFEMETAAAIDELRRGGDTAVAVAESALSRWTGPVLPNDPYAAWRVEAAERAERKLLELLDRLIDHHERTGDAQRAVDLLSKAIAVHPYDEARHARAARLLIGQGRYAAAVEVLDAAEAMARELGVPTSPEVDAARREIPTGSGR